MYIANSLKEMFVTPITKTLSGMTPEDINTTMSKYGLLYGFMIIMIVVLGIAMYDPGALDKNTYIYLFSAIVPLFIIMGFVIPFAREQQNSKYTFFIIGLILCFFTALVFFYSSSSLTSLFYVSAAVNVVLLLILMVALALVFLIFSNYLKSLSGWLGFFVYFIFYIPCLLIDFFNYVIREFKMTSNSAYILFVIEIILLLIYFYIPKIMELIIYSNNTVLLKESAFLDIPKVIGNSEMFKMKNSKDLILADKQIVYRRNYSLSMWIYLNNQSPNTSAYSKETPIFDYGGGKPKICYYNDVTNADGTDKYIIYFTNLQNVPSNYEITLPSQKWNYFVFNYSSTKVDLFVNGSIMRTFNYKDNLPLYLASDNITIGNDDGLNGAICNVQYFTIPLTNQQIANSYNLLMYKNPPTI